LFRGRRFKAKFADRAPHFRNDLALERFYFCDRTDWSAYLLRHRRGE
jgi:hypothetical protein